MILCLCAVNACSPLQEIFTLGGLPLGSPLFVAHSTAVRISFFIVCAAVMSCSALPFNFEIIQRVILHPVMIQIIFLRKSLCSSMTQEKDSRIQERKKVVNAINRDFGETVASLSNLLCCFPFAFFCLWREGSNVFPFSLGNTKRML